MMSSTARRIALVVAIVAVCLAADRASKRLAVALLPEERRISLAGDVVRLELVRNPGAFLGLGAGLGERTRGALFTWGTGLLIVGALVIALRRRTPPAAAAGAALVTAGGLGNLWDRATTGGLVVDFLNLGIGPVRTGIFNVADVAIVAGAVLVALRRVPR